MLSLMMRGSHTWHEHPPISICDQPSRRLRTSQIKLKAEGQKRDSTMLEVSGEFLNFVTRLVVREVWLFQGSDRKDHKQDLMLPDIPFARGVPLRSVALSTL